MVKIFPLAVIKSLSPQGEYRLLSSHRHVINMINTKGDLLSFHSKVTTLSSFGILLRQDDFDLMRTLINQKLNVIHLSEHEFIFGNYRLSKPSRILRFDLGRLPKLINKDLIKCLSVNRNNGFGCTNKLSTVDRLPPIKNVIDFLESPTLTSSENLLDYVGLGPGLTPSYDDVLIGMLAVIYWCKLDYKYLHHLKNVIAKIDLGQKTTSVSQAYIVHAIQGEFSYPIYRLVGCFSSIRQLGKPELETFLQHGHTSGVDTLLGITLTLKHILRD